MEIENKNSKSKNVDLTHKDQTYDTYDLYDFIYLNYRFGFLHIAMAVLGFFVVLIFGGNEYQRISASQIINLNDDKLVFFQNSKVKFDYMKLFYEMENNSDEAYKHITSDLKIDDFNLIAKELPKYSVFYEKETDDPNIEIVYTDTLSASVTTDDVIDRLELFVDYIERSFELSALNHIENLKLQHERNSKRATYLLKRSLEYENKISRANLEYHVDFLKRQKNLAVAAGIEFPRDNAAGFSTTFDSSNTEDGAVFLNGFKVISEKIKELENILASDKIISPSHHRLKKDLIYETEGNTKINQLVYLIDTAGFKLDKSSNNLLSIKRYNIRVDALNTSVPYKEYLGSLMFVILSVFIVIIRNGIRRKLV